MKNYKDMADAVFRRRDEYVASVKRKKKIALNASLSLCAVCLATLGAFGIWQSGVLTPDPNVIGTRPPYMTEATDPSKHVLGSNATSEGVYSENTQVVSGNSKPHSSTGNSPESSDSTNPQGTNKATDPVEKPVGPTQSTKPAIKPTSPQVKPSLPDLPTLPVGPDLPSPDVPPTSDDTPKPPVVLPTDPMEVPEVTAATDSGEYIPPTDDTPKPPTTAAPTTEGSDNAGSDGIDGPGWPGVPDEPVATEPCWTVATEPATESPVASDPCVEPTEPTVNDAEVPPTSVDVNRVEGKVVDQYGNPIKGAVVKVYYDGMVVGTDITGSNGYYYMAMFRAPATIEVDSVPSGYSLSDSSVTISKGYNYVVLTCNKK